MAIDYQLAINYNGRQIEQGDFTREMLVRLVQAWQEGHSLGVDGKCGPKTQASIAADIPPTPIVGGPWTPWDGPLEKQPRNKAELYAMFGVPGDESSAWAKANIIECQGQHAFPGVPTIWYVKILRPIEPYAREGLRRAQISSLYKIERCGGYVYRFSQYNSELGLSYHASGAALDFDAIKNGARRFKPEDLPTPFSPEWRKLWPNGVDESFVLAMESCGWHWGGRWTLPDKSGYVFVDPMHFQWVGGGAIV